MSTLALMPSFTRRSDHTIRVAKDKDRMIALEAGDDQTVLVLTELTLCLVGCLALLGGLWVLWSSFQEFTIGAIADPFLTGSILVAVGLGLYAFGTRGFRRQFIVNTTKRCVEFGRVNSKGTCRVNTSIPLDQVKSLYTQRAANGTGRAYLMLRAGNDGGAQCVLSGKEAHVRDLHDQICHTIAPHTKNVLMSEASSRAAGRVYQLASG